MIRAAAGGTLVAMDLHRSHLARALSAVVIVDAAYRGLVRPRLQRLGVTEDELRRPLPGDDLLQGQADAATMGTTIDAPREDVWPWLVQMGCDRAGWYSIDALDNAARRSAESVLPEFQRLEVGDRLSSDPCGRGRWWFDVAAVEHERFLVLRASIDLRTGRPYDPRDGRPSAYSDSTWAFVLESLGSDRTRLIVRTRGQVRPAWRALPQRLLVGLPQHSIMQTAQFRGLRRRAERLHRERSAVRPKARVA